MSYPSSASPHRGDELPDVHELNQQEGRQLLDSKARQYLGVSGEEFVRLWKQGHYRNADQPELMYLASLLPLVDP